MVIIIAMIMILMMQKGVEEEVERETLARIHSYSDLFLRQVGIIF